ncbi:MAG: cache domain-containing protein [Proteobacteria bacterium]|nr:cache domain-containing protein [Pseudomonadota bacterium]
MFNFLQNIKIAQKLLIFNIIFLCGGMIDIYLSFSSIKESVISQKKEKLKNFVESATSYMNEIAKDIEKGTITEEAAKQKIFEYIDSTRFDNGNYFWIHDLNLQMVRHPIQEKLNNTNVGEMSDPKGVLIFKEFNKIIADHGQGYLEYSWPKPGEIQAAQKLSYVVEFPAFKWIIGTGVYIDNVKQNIWDLGKKDLFFMLIITILFQCIILFISRSISKPFKGIESIVHKLINNHHEEIIIPQKLGTNEIGMMYRGLKELNETFLVNARLKNSLDSANVSLMILDQADQIVYNNKAMDSLYEKHKKTFDQFFVPTAVENVFTSKHLQDINDLFKDNLLNLSIPTQTKIECEGCILLVKAHPVLNLLSNKIGTFIQFEDITEEAFMKKQVEYVIHEVANGNLSIRLDSFKMSGFFKTLSNDINDFIDLIEKVVSDIARTMKALASGNLTQHINNDYKGILELVKSDTNTAINELEKVMHKIVGASQELLNTSESIYKGSQELSYRTEQQASNLEETAASMEELASTVRQTTEHASSANKLASKTKTLATDGGTIVEKTIVAMQSIEESFKKIDSIVLVMDEIAFQTNLLALNAAVEAARAGETGKGFAVVAEEVRALAQRSAQASKQIKIFMEESSENVKNGVYSVNHTGERLNEIVDAAKEVANLIEDIATASAEQTSNLEQINLAISEMDHMTQANAAFVEKNTSSADGLNQKADDLTIMMKFFTFKQASTEFINQEMNEENSDELQDIDLDLSTFKFQEDIQGHQQEQQEHKNVYNEAPSSSPSSLDDADWKDF